MQLNRSTEVKRQDPRPSDQGSPKAEPALQKVIAALRKELSECGDMLVLLDRQQKLILTRRPEALIENAESMNTRIETLAAARSMRQRASRELAEALGQPAFSSFGHLLCLAPSEDQPLLKALVGAINSILYHCQQRLLENKLLLGPPPLELITSRTQGRSVLFGCN